MNIGPLDRLITIEQATITRNDTGGEIRTFNTFITCWAHVLSLGGNEKIMDDAFQAFNITTFYIRYQAGITEKMRIVYNSINYDIKSIIEHERRSFLQIKAEKRDNE